METFDVVLFSPPSRMLNHYRPPVSLLYLGGYLTHHGIKVKIIDTPVREQIRDKHFFAHYQDILTGIRHRMIENLKHIDTGIIGITCYSTEYVEVVELIREIKQIKPAVKIIVGGIHPTFMPRDFFEENTGVDICVVGEGEITLLELVRCLLRDKNTDPRNISGLVYKDARTNEIKTTAPRSLPQNLDEISFPDYSLIDMEYYTNASPYAIRGCYLRSMYILATRGCPSQCTFCVAKKLKDHSGKGNYTRIRTADSLIDEIRSLKENYKIDGFYFIDDMFTISKDNVRAFCYKLKTEKLSLLWGCSSKVSTLDDELLKLMSESGCIQIDFGVERGSDQALRIIKKGITVKKIIEVFDLCHHYGIRTLANMLINVPEETQQDLQDILRLLDRIKADVVYVNIFFPFPGTEIYEGTTVKFKRNEYYLLSQDIGTLLDTQPERFRFANHRLDLKEWEVKNYKKYNSFLRNLSFYFLPKYWRVILKSSRKENYWKQLSLLVREFINQKFNFGSWRKASS